MADTTPLAPGVFLLPGVLTRDECDALVERAEGAGFRAADVRTSGGPVRRTDIRDNDRLEWPDPALAASLWAKVGRLVPSPFEGGEAVGLDEQFRFYRYEPGQRFNRHRDGGVAPSPHVRSRLTLLVYLNDAVGGETVFYADELLDGVRPGVLRVAPSAGAVLLFRHEWWHEGRPVTSGRKYVLRTDVLYRFAARDGSSSGS